MIVIVFAPMPEPHANLIDRYLVAAEHAGIRPQLLDGRKVALHRFAVLAQHFTIASKEHHVELHTGCA